MEKSKLLGRKDLKVEYLHIYTCFWCMAEVAWCTLNCQVNDGGPNRLGRHRTFSNLINRQLKVYSWGSNKRWLEIEKQF